MNMTDKLEAIRIIKERKKSAHEYGTLECFDTFENGIECCLAGLEGRAPNYISKCGGLKNG